MKKTLPLLAIALALSVNAYAYQIADGRYEGTYNSVNLNTMQTTFNTISAKESGGVDVGMVVVWNRAENPLNWEKWMECNGAHTPEERAKLLDSDMCKSYGICTVPDFTGRFLRQRGGNSGAVGSQQEDAVMNATVGSQGSDDIRPWGTMIESTWKAGGGIGGGPGLEWCYTGSLAHAYGAEHIANEIRPKSHTVRYLIRINE